MIKIIIATLCLACVSSPAQAEKNIYSQHYNACMNNAGGVTVEMQNCISNEYTRQDARLNLAYRKLTAQVSTSRKRELLTAQRLWIQFRDANCKFYADPNGGTIALLNTDSCMLDMTAQRANELENLAN